MKNLLKIYHCNSDMGYYEIIVESVINGQIEQSKNQFKAMPKKNQKAFVMALYGDNWRHGLNEMEIKRFIELL